VASHIKDVSKNVVGARTTLNADLALFDDVLEDGVSCELETVTDSFAVHEDGVVEVLVVLEVGLARMEVARHVVLEIFAFAFQDLGYELA
jgi:hypothetical protein